MPDVVEHRLFGDLSCVLAVCAVHNSVIILSATLLTTCVMMCCHCSCKRCMTS
jgi:hypothetical protein